MSESGKNLRQIAQVLKSNGTDGELIMGFRDIAPEDINTKEPVFIYFDGLPVPFFINSFTKRGSNKALVHITDIMDYNDAEELVGKGVFADKSALETDFDDDDLSMLVGWTLIYPHDQEEEEVGEITDYLDIPGNPCIEIKTFEDEEFIIIPLHEDLILGLDPKHREIYMKIPEGLL